MMRTGALGWCCTLAVIRKQSVRVVRSRIAPQKDWETGWSSRLASALLLFS